MIVDLLMSVLSFVYREISQSALSPAANGCQVDPSKSLTPAGHIGWLFEEFERERASVVDLCKILLLKLLSVVDDRVEGERQVGVL